MTRSLVNVVQPIRFFRDQPLTPVYRRWMCGDEGCDGEMKPTGVCYASMPPQYPHRCEKCSRAESATISYPRVAWLPIEKLDTGEASAVSDDRSAADAQEVVR